MNGPARYRHGCRSLAGLAVVALTIVACSSTASQSPTASTSPSDAGPAPGVTADSISVGVPYDPGASAANQQQGAGGVTVGDEKADAQIVIDDVNAHGGVAGRKLVPVFYPASTSGTPQAQLQAECTYFTQDHKVFAVFSDGPPSYLQCLGDAGVVVVNDNLVASGAATFHLFPFWVEVSAFNLDRIPGPEVNALSAQGYFAPWDTTTGAPGGSATKVGILTFDDPDFAHAVDQELVPALADAGYANPDIVRIGESGSASAQTAAISNAVLRFRTDQVDHVIIFESSGALAFYFVKDAATQNYHPRYAANTNNGFQALITGAGLPKDELTGAVGLGWNPVLDLPYDQNPLDGPYSNQARRHCQQLMAAGGQQFSDANAETVANLTCNSIYLFRAALDTQGGHVSRDSFLAGLNTLGSSFQAASSFGTHFGPDQHDGGDGYYYWAYRSSCGCMAYTGSLHHAG